MDPEKGKKNKKIDHFCYKLNIIRGLEYIIQHGIQKEVDRPFCGCREVAPPRVLSHPNLGYIGNVQTIPTIEEALFHLQTQPLGAGMPIFEPEYTLIQEVCDLL